jgi:hypothetical protein
MSAILEEAARRDPQRARDLDLTDANLRAIHAAAVDVDAMEAERQAKREHLTEQMQSAIDGGDAWQTVFFAGKHFVRVQGPGSADDHVHIYRNVGDVLFEAMDLGEGSHNLIQFVLDAAAEGDKRAQELLGGLVKDWTEAQL